MRKSTLLRGVPIAAVAVLLLTGCSGGGNGPDAEDEQSPLTAYMNAIYGMDGTPEEQEKMFAAQQVEREELIAQCMQEEGFEYTPDTQNGSFSTDGSEYKPEDRDWVSQWGYGAVNYPGQDEMSDPGNEWVDPNGEYLETLSESERTAFYEALSGPAMSEDEMSEDGSFEYDWKTAGCNGWANHEISGDDPTQSEEFAPLIEAMSDLYTDASTAPEMVKVDTAWAECMDAAGFPGFSTQSEAQNSIYNAMNALWEDPAVAESGPDEDAMKELSEQEIETALADLDCREETDYRDRAKAVQWELEEQFIADHKAELDALKAAAEQARS